MSHSLIREDSLSCHDLEGQNKVMTPDTEKRWEKRSEIDLLYSI